MNAAASRAVPFPAPRLEEGARWEASAASGGEDHKPRADTASTAVVSSSAGHTSTSLEGVESVAWESLAFRQDLWPLRSYAHHPEDIPLISKFLELTPLTSIVPAAGKLLLRVLRFLHMCDYRLEDICAILAHASAYFMDVYSQCAGMQATEVGHILATLIFIAHCYVQDETCPLNIWQKHLFKKYCSLKVLNMAVIRLLEIRRYRLRLPQDDLWKRLEALASSIATCTSIDTSFGRPPPLSSGSPTAPQAQIAGGDDRREGRGYDSSQRTGERPLASSSLHGNGASGNRSAGASVFASIARRTLSRIRATEDRARDLSSRLQSMPPICKYKGFIPASRELCGETFTQQCLSARETPRTAGGGTPFEAWAKTGVGAAGRIVCQGKGLRVDLQEQHAAEQCRAGLATIMSARDKRAPFLLSGNRQPRNQAIQLSYNPGSQRTRADATCMEAAGAVSFCRRFDQFRQENYRRAIFEAIRNNEMSAGRQPPCSSREVKGEAVWPSTHPGGPATMACQFSEGWSGTPMWQLAQGREETMRKEREAREAQAGDVLEIDNEAAGFRSVLYVSRMVGDKYDDSKVRGPRRKTRAQAIKDGLSLRNACRDAPKDAKLEAAQRRSVELMYTFWKPEELPKEDFDFEESVEKPMRLRLARKPRGNGWQRVGDKAWCLLLPLDPMGSRHAAAWEPALAMLHQLETGAFGIQPTVHHYGAVASCLEFVKNWEKALALMRSLQSRGLMPSVQFCGAIITACEKSCQWERALSLLRRMGELSAGPDVMAFNTSIAACGKGRRWKDAVLLLAEMSSSELLPSVVMSALERSRQWMLAVMIMDGILARGLEADYITWNSVISACESGSQWAQALRMLHRARLCFVADPSGMPQKLKRGTNSVISACGKASRWPLGVQLLRMMREDGPDGTQDHVKQPAMDMDILCFNSLLLHMNGAHWKTAACLLQEMVLLELSADLTTYRGCTIAFQEGACHSGFYYQIAQSAVELPRALRSVERFRQEEHAIEVALTASRLRGLHCLPLQADRMIQRVVEAPARASLSLLSLRSEFFRHCSAPMAFDPVKGRYLKIDAETNSYIDCDVPHDPIEYSVSVSVGASLVGQTDEDLNAPDRPRTMLLKELVKTGAAMKTPLFFLDQPAACFAMFDGVRGGAAAEWCSKHLHTKLLPQLSASITYWHDADLRGLLRSILSELDVQLVQQAGCCWEGVSIAVALLLGDRLVVASLGGTHALVAAPDGRWRSLDGRHVASSAEEQARSKALGAEIVGEEKGKGVVGAPFVQKAVKARDWQVVEDATAEEEVARVLDRTSDCFATLGLGPEDKIDGKAARSCYKKLALKVHPDKAPEELKARAKAAFEKVEKAAADVEAFCETDVEATECLHRILHAAGPKRASMLRATAFDVLGISEDCSLEEAGRQGRDLRETIMKLGMLTGGNYGHPDQAEAVRMIEEAAEAIAEPAALTASKGGGSFSSLKPIQVTRALGLRDLKLPRKIVSSEPQIDVIQLEALGSHHLVLLSSGATSLSDQEVIERIRGFSGQPKAGSLLVAADAAAKNAAQSITGPQRFGCCIVGVFEVGSGYVEPAAKKAKKDGGDKVSQLRIGRASVMTSHRLGFYWWHVSHADASLAERGLSHAVQSFHVAHWCHAAWRGVNLGGWMLLEPGPASPFFNLCHAKILELGGGPAQESLETSFAGDPPRENPPGLCDEYSVCAALQAAGGECLRSELFRWHRSQHYTEQTFADIAKTGLNAVRVPFGYWVVQGPGSGEPYEGPCLEVLDGCVQMAEAHGLQVLLDLHGNPGGESGSRPCGREYAAWKWEDWRHDEAVEVLRVLAARYCDKSCVTGVQVCNEPSENIPADRLCDFYEQAIEAIRSSGMGPDKVAVVLPIFTHWRMKEMLSCWNSRGNSFKFDNIAFDIHYYHDFSAIWRLLPHYRHIEVVAEHARELKLLPGSVVGEWSLSRPGHFSEEEKADFAQKQVVAYNHASHGWFFWNWHDHAFYPDWDLEKGVFGSGKLPCPLRQEELQGFLFPAWEGSGPVTRPLAQAERELMRLKESLTKDTSQFPAMARKHSECKSALQPGQMAGDLGWISKGSLGDQAMEDVVLALEVNELSDLVTTARGVHLVQRYA
ncbi:exgA [Symbiodinium microadriaticum]|nr:exgA [Symbiodinium microadriaticum]